LAYGRLSQKSINKFQIYQMAVEPKYQRIGLGKLILQALIEAAISQGARFLILNARVTQVPFYKKSGFETTGKVFPSLSTGVSHIKMRKVIL
jgi:GNAT superfamily N-acetyltransferase